MFSIISLRYTQDCGKTFNKRLTEYRQLSCKNKNSYVDENDHISNHYLPI